MYNPCAETLYGLFKSQVLFENIVRCKKLVDILFVMFRSQRVALLYRPPP